MTACDVHYLLSCSVAASVIWLAPASTPLLRIHIVYEYNVSYSESLRLCDKRGRLLSKDRKDVRKISECIARDSSHRIDYRMNYWLEVTKSPCQVTVVTSSGETVFRDADCLTHLATAICFLPSQYGANLTCFIATTASFEQEDTTKSSNPVSHRVISFELSTLAIATPYLMTSLLFSRQL